MKRAVAINGSPRTGGIRTRSLSISGTRRLAGRLPECSGRRICSLTEAVCAKIRK